jgi:hypothetical protein
MPRVTLECCKSYRAGGGAQPPGPCDRSRREAGGPVKDGGGGAILEPKRWLAPLHQTDPTLQHVDPGAVGDVVRAFFGKTVYDSGPTLQLGVFRSIE